MRELLRSEYRDRTLHAKEWPRCSKMVSMKRRPSSVSSASSIVINQRRQHQRRRCRASTLVKQTVLRKQNRPIAGIHRRIAARIIGMHVRYVLTLLVKLGATGWIAGIATDS